MRLIPIIFLTACTPCHFMDNYDWQAKALRRGCNGEVYQVQDYGRTVDNRIQCGMPGLPSCK